MTYRLKQNTTDSIFEDSGRTEKEDHNVNLFSWQFEALDKLAEEKGVSRNEILRRILSSHLQKDGGLEIMEE